jgi:hypothetical protein
MMKYASVLVVAILAFCGMGLAQPAPPDTPSGDSTDALMAETPPVSDPGAEPAPAALSGDVIHLKSGKIISGGQVIRKAPTTVFVEVLPGVPLLELPLSQVESIEYDEIDSMHERAPVKPAVPETVPDYIQGKELSPELSKKLRRSITDTDISIQDEDYVTVVTRIAERMNIPLTIGPKIQELPAAARRWSANIPAGTSFIVLLYEHLLLAFPRVKETYEYGQIQLTLRRPEEPGPGTAPPLPAGDATTAPSAPADSPPAFVPPEPAPDPPSAPGALPADPAQ